MSADPTLVTKIELWPADLPLTDPFVVATGSRVTAELLFVRVTLSGGARGYGEIAPFPEVGGEDRASALQAAAELARAALGRSATEYQPLGRLFLDRASAHPAARCGLETALLDALCRHLSIPLWGFWGGADVRVRETDITIPIADLDKSVALAQSWYRRGFRVFKTKVGTDVESDIRRLEAMHRACPDVAFIADANQGFTVEACRKFLASLRAIGVRLQLLEQPVPREDWDGMVTLTREAGVPVAADESVRSLEDAKRVAQMQAAQVINIKITKTGLLQAMEIAKFAKSAGFGLMAGGMVEARVAMGCSFALVLGLGGFEFLDLDTPLLLATDPVTGGFRYEGPKLHPWSGPGLDLTVTPTGPVMTIA
ncbi:MAG: dipeptide epimerase [Nitrospiraceae bacterium]